MLVPPNTEGNGKTVVLFRECGHIPHIEHPDQFLADFLPFLAG
jgi:pimeloyl-ACP methyl ester carboxylesterase